MIRDLSIWDRMLPDKINDIKQNPHGITKIILNSAIEYQYDMIHGRRDMMEDLLNYTKEQGMELHIITGSHSNFKLIDTTNEYTHVQIHYWPTFWLSLAYSRLCSGSNYSINLDNGLDVNDINVGSGISIKYPFITMNKVPKVHRSIMIDMLAKNDIVDKGLIIWREPTQNYQYKYWKEQILLLDQKEKFNSQETLPAEYTYVFAQIIGESDEIVFSLSEKTGMALFFNKPFLVLGCKHFHKILKSLGFQLYDELFDYSFDDIDDVTERADLIAQNIKKYTDKTLEELNEIYLSVFSKCVENKKTLLRLATNSSLIPKIWQELIDYQLENNIVDYPIDINNFIKAREDEYRF